MVPGNFVCNKTTPRPLIKVEQYCGLGRVVGDAEGVSGIRFRALAEWCDRPLCVYYVKPFEWSTSRARLDKLRDIDDLNPCLGLGLFAYTK